MHKKLRLDIESFSECNLKKSGLYAYAYHPTTEILCVAYAFDDEPVNLWIPDKQLPAGLIAEMQRRMGAEGDLHIGPCPDDLSNWIRISGKMSSHNFSFERVMLNGPPGQRIDVPKIRIDQGACTAAKAATYGLPRALGDAARAMGTYPKSEDGKAGMMQLAKPRKKGKESRYTPQNSPDKFVNLYMYCIDDVKAERDLDKHIPDLSASEQLDWELDQKMNDRGVLIDRARVEDCQFLIDTHKANIEVEFVKETGIKPSQTAEVSQWIRAQGYDILNLQKDTCAAAIEDPTCPKKVKRAISLRSIHASKAVAKYKAILQAIMDDDRVRGMFLYYGAHSGRWASMIVQLQNLFRGILENPDLAIDAYKIRDLDWIKILYSDEPMKVFASTVRGMLIAPEGKDLISVDYAGIESRMIAWIYDETWKLEAFRKQDKEGGPDNYMLAYANVFQIDPRTVNKKQRQIGKPIDLGLGFEGGIGAFVTMSKTYNVDLDELTDAAWGKIPERFMALSKRDFDEGYISVGDLPERTALICNAIKHSWRASHPKIAQGWKETKHAAIVAVENPGMTTCIPSKKLMFRYQDRWLQMRLPSGRKLSYFAPRIEGDGSVSFMGIDTKTRRWMRCKSYGGFWAQNGTQAAANDLLRNAIRKLDTFKGIGKMMKEYMYDVVGSVHDEGIAEVPEGEGSVEELAEIFCQLPKWANGLPVAAEGWRAKRYKK